MERVLGRAAPASGSVVLRAALEKESTMASARATRRDGRVRIVLELDAESKVTPVPNLIWTELRRVIFQQLLRSALFQGSSAAKPDVTVALNVAIDSGTLSFRFASDLAIDPESDPSTDVSTGLATANSIVQHLGGQLSAESEGGQFVVKFNVPLDATDRRTTAG